MWVQPKPKVQQPLKTGKKKGTVSTAVVAKIFAEHSETAVKTHTHHYVSMPILNQAMQPSKER